MEVRTAEAFVSSRDVGGGYASAVTLLFRSYPLESAKVCDVRSTGGFAVRPESADP